MFVCIFVSFVLLCAFSLMLEFFKGSALKLDIEVLATSLVIKDTEKVKT